ncbi:CoA-transferase family III [Coemansia reversa NRRL 1564]|uniref:CoA-transferase family III n=1 Tax=Coemansia reversa (strain ATCC 12441 / NRRL 1564) TaxID=763665 RepID=A0A2G5B4G4_COERN|nr:CoA-transferase family III [Coemansia reversa NRRL 1564]|eukprot:PIA13881.1 CoA-transferase family III [Coemansia reversa NRRL 1564]
MKPLLRAHNYTKKCFILHRQHNTSTANKANPLPLDGIRVLDMTRILAGPYCTMLLGDLGAEVIKVEHPQRGDDTRTWGPPFKEYQRSPITTKNSSQIPPEFPGESAYYLSVNRNKKSIAIDIKQESGKQIIKDLATKCDILVENFVPGKLSEMGLGFKELSKANPGLIYASISGYGSTGPYSKKPGYDVIIEAEAGLMHITGEENGTPVKVGVAVTDIMTGLYTHGAIMAALLARQKTNCGQHIDASLIQTQTSMLANIASNYLIGGEEAKRWGTLHPSIAPYQVFKTKDGSICIGAGNNIQFEKLCYALGIPQLSKDSRFLSNIDRVTNRKDLVKIIEDLLCKKTTKQTLALLNNSGLPYGPVNNLKQTFDHPQIKARGVVREIEHPLIGNIKLVGPAVQYSEAPVGQNISPPPMLGQHTEQILRSVLGYSDCQIQNVVRSGGAAIYDYCI